MNEIYRLHVVSEVYSRFRIDVSHVPMTQNSELYKSILDMVNAIEITIYGDFILVYYILIYIF